MVSKSTILTIGIAIVVALSAINCAYVLNEPDKNADRVADDASDSSKNIIEQTDAVDTETSEQPALQAIAWGRVSTMSSVSNDSNGIALPNNASAFRNMLGNYDRDTLLMDILIGSSFNHCIYTNSVNNLNDVGRYIYSIGYGVLGNCTISTNGSGDRFVSLETMTAGDFLDGKWASKDDESQYIKEFIRYACDDNTYYHGTILQVLMGTPFQDAHLNISTVTNITTLKDSLLTNYHIFMMLTSSGTDAKSVIALDTRAMCGEYTYVRVDEVTPCVFCELDVVVEKVREFKTIEEYLQHILEVYNGYHGYSNPQDVYNKFINSQQSNSNAMPTPYVDTLYYVTS